LFVSNLYAQLPTTRGHLIPRCSVAVSLDTRFAVKDSLNKAGDLPTHLHPPLLACFMVSNGYNKLPSTLGLVTSVTPLGLVTSVTPPEVCMPLHAVPALSALTMVAIDGEPLPDQQRCLEFS